MILNAAQAAAVASDAPRILVSACPGSGKTATLAARAARLITEGWAPGSICLLTFTRAAAAEMRRRIAAMLMGDAAGLTACTLDALAYRILVEFGTPRYREGLTVIDEAERGEMLAELIHANAWEREKGLQRRAEKLLLPETEAGPAGDDRAERLVRQCRHRVATMNAVDLAELTPSALRLLEERPAAAAALRERWAHVLVDEYQDTSEAQQRVLDAIAPRNLFCVGDCDQAIFEWRGAHPAGFLAFGARADVELHRLEQNYRSLPEIVAGASALIRRNLARFASTMRAGREDAAVGPALVCRRFATAEEEARAIAAEILALREPWACAILARTHAALEPVELALAKASIPYRNLKRLDDEWKTPAMRLVVHLLRVLCNQQDDRATELVLRRCGLATEDDLARWRLAAHERQGALQAAILADCVGQPVQGWAHHLDCARHEAANLILSQAATEMIAGLPIEIGRNLVEIPARLRAWSEDRADSGVDDFLAWYSTRLLADHLRRDQEPAVTLSTVHSAKGLEWPVVYIVGLEEGLFPLSRAVDAGELEEERRLFYVAITRAQDRAVLSWCETRAQRWGPPRKCEPSRFIAELSGLKSSASAALLDAGSISSDPAAAGADTTTESGGGGVLGSSIGTNVPEVPESAAGLSDADEEGTAREEQR